MENTPENKARFTALYFGQGVGSNSGYIVLKSLKDFSDEDALKIAELLPWRSNISASAVIAQTKELLLNQFQTNLYRENWSDIIDKIRELGYAHKWNGLTVERQIQYGWIKLKSE